MKAIPADSSFDSDLIEIETYPTTIELEGFNSPLDRYGWRVFYDGELVYEEEHPCDVDRVAAIMMAQHWCEERAKDAKRAARRFANEQWAKADIARGALRVSLTELKD